MDTTPEERQPKLTEDRHRTVLNVMDKCYGAYFMGLLAVVGVAAYRNETSWRGFVLQLLFPVVNLAISQISIRLKDPKKFELCRIATNCVLGPLGFVFVDGVLDQFWFNCLALTMGAPIIITSVTSKTAYGWLVVGLNILGMVLAALFSAKPVNWYQFVIFMGYALMLGIFITQTMSVLMKTLAKEHEKTKELQKSQKIIIEQQQAVVSSSKMSALGEMAGGVAHEINTPLAVIKILSEQLAEVVDEATIDKALVKDMVSEVGKTTDRIARIVQGLRSFSRDGSKDPFLTVNVRELIDETLSFCSECFKNQGTQLTVEDFDPGLSFMGHPTEISQVLLNLLNNANDAISGLSEKWVRISVLKSGAWIEIQVTDSGKGIPPENREKIFQPFFTTKEIGKGTGMGLSISSGIVRNHGGELKLDEGCSNTRFVFRLAAK